MSEPDFVVIRCELDDVEAWALAQLVKRMSMSEFIRCAVNNDEAYLMASAVHELRKALAREGYAPR